MKKITNQEFTIRLAQSNPYVIPLEEYMGMKTKIWVMCKQCGHKWETDPDHLLQGKRCRICAMKDVGRQRTVKWEDVEHAFLMYPYKLLSTPDEYVDANVSCLRCLCEEHGEFKISWTNFRKFEGCPMCQGSRGENKIFKFLKSYDITFERQFSFDGLVGVSNKLLRYDFYIPSVNLLIEYQGEFHDGTAWQQTEEEFQKQKEHDRRKKSYAQKHNIELLEIWYYEFDDIEDILIKKLL